MSNEFNIELGIQVKQSDIDNLQKNIKAKVGNIDIGLNIGNEWLEKIYNKLDGIKITPTIVTDEVEDGLKKIKTSWGKSKSSITFNPEIDPHAFEQIEARINKVRNSIDSLAKVNISTNGTDEIQKAVLSYTNEVGIAVRETMAWKTAIEEVSGEQTEIKTFETVKIDYNDNIAQVDKLAESIENLKSKLTQKVDNLKLGNYSDSDISKFVDIQNKISDISDISKESELALKNLGKELINLVNRTKLGDIKNDTGLNFKSSVDEIKQYMSALNGVKLEQVQVTELSPFKDKATGEEIRRTTVLVEEGRNKWREYTTAISSTSNEVRILQGDLKNVNSNLANKQDVILARLQSKISNFQSEIDGKIKNIKLGDIAPQDITSLNKLQSEINSITTETDDAEQKIRQLKKTFEELADALKRGKLADKKTFDIGVESTNEEYKKYIANLKNVSAEHVKIEQTFIKFGKNKEILKVVNSLVNEGEGGWHKYQHTFNATTEDVRELDKGFKDIGVSADLLSANLMKVIGNFISFSAIIGLFKQGIDYILELNNALNQIRIVTGMTQQEVQKLGLSYNQLAKDMNVSTKEVTQSAVEFFRQGMGESKVLESLQEAIKYSKISGVELKQSAELITATVNSMNVSAERAIDVFSYLGDATATGKLQCA